MRPFVTIPIFFLSTSLAMHFVVLVALVLTWAYRFELYMRLFTARQMSSRAHEIHSRAL